ncbi:MAG TPA: Fic family protein [Acidimicrobiales bacterium]|nr:Fic family protein [Acidimicrobiales bacterium]
MGGREVEIRWNARPARAWLPDPLSDVPLDLSTKSVRQTERAAAAVVRAADRLPPNWEPLARLLLRAEGVASSSVEGLRSPLVEVAAAEVDDRAVPSSAAWVADNLEAVAQAVRSAPGAALTVEELHRWHRRLMVHSHLPEEFRGTFRTAQGWIGGSSPRDAVYVPPPPEAVAPLMDDLVGFAHRTDVDPVTQAAALHAQFETIHPYGDGNGRIGRVLIAWTFVRRLSVTLPPPVSVLIARDPGGYLSGLYQFRVGEVDRWVGWFAEVVERSGRATLSLVDDIGDLVDAWTAQLADLRADASARTLVSLLPEHPVVSAPLVAARLGVSDPTARAAIAVLAARGILRELDFKGVGRGRPAAWFAADQLIELVSRWAG